MAEMTEEKIAEITEALTGLTASQWGRVKSLVDQELNFRAAQLVIGGSKEIQKRLEIEFNCRRYSE